MGPLSTLTWLLLPSFYSLEASVVGDTAVVLNAAVRGEADGDPAALSFMNSWAPSVSCFGSCV